MLEDTCRGLMQGQQGIQLRAGATLMTEGATSAEEAGASSMVCEQVPWYLVACETPGHATLESCTLPRTASCFGRVKMGYGERWSDWRHVHGKFDCSNGFFGGDPAPGQAKECVCEEQASDRSSVKATDLVEWCGTQCREKGYCCNDPQIGSNQMISCAQACMMRHNSVALNKMLSENGGFCNRNGGSGCGLNDGITDYSFCQTCNDLTERCPHGVQSAEECDFGARAYDGLSIGIPETKDQCFQQVLELFSAETCPMIVWSDSNGVTCDCRHRCKLYETVEGEVWETYTFEEVEAISSANSLTGIVAGASIAFIAVIGGFFLWRRRQQKLPQPCTTATSGATPQSEVLAGSAVEAPELTVCEAQPTEAEELPVAIAVPVDSGSRH